MIDYQTLSKWNDTRDAHLNDLFHSPTMWLTILYQSQSSFHSHPQKWSFIDIHQHPIDLTYSCCCNVNDWTSPDLCLNVFINSITGSEMESLRMQSCLVIEVSQGYDASVTPWFLINLIFHQTWLCLFCNNNTLNDQWASLLHIHSLHQQIWDSQKGPFICP